MDEEFDRVAQAVSASNFFAHGLALLVATGTMLRTDARDKADVFALGVQSALTEDEYARYERLLRQMAYDLACELGGV